MNYFEIYDKDKNLLGYLLSSKEGGRLRNIVYMTESGDYTKPAWLKFAIVKGVAGGGGGGGCASTGSSSSACGSSGAGGGYFEKRIVAASLGATETVTIGAGGAGGAAGANAGVAGGTTSFGAHCSATGGAGGAAGASETGGIIVVGVAGGAGTGGDLNINGGDSTAARIYSAVPMSFSVSGGSIFALSVETSFDSGGSDGSAGIGYGGGGAAGANHKSQGTARAGGAGSPGIVIIEEYE